MMSSITRTNTPAASAMSMGLDSILSAMDFHLLLDVGSAALPLLLMTLLLLTGDDCNIVLMPKALPPLLLFVIAVDGTNAAGGTVAGVARRKARCNLSDWAVPKSADLLAAKMSGEAMPSDDAMMMNVELRKKKRNCVCFSLLYLRTVTHQSCMRNQTHTAQSSDTSLVCAYIAHCEDAARRER